MSATTSTLLTTSSTTATTATTRNRPTRRGCGRAGGVAACCSSWSSAGVTRSFSRTGDGRSHRLARPTPVAGGVVGLGKPVPAPPVLRLRLHLVAPAGEQRIGGGPVHPPGRGTRQLVGRHPFGVQ